MRGKEQSPNRILILVTTFNFVPPMNAFGELKQKSALRHAKRRKGKEATIETF